MVTSSSLPTFKPLRYAMVGGGRDAFIGAVHRMAAALDGQAVLVAGALSSTPDKSIASGRDLGLERVYPTWQAMLEAELALPPDQRIDFVSIVTPNHVHFPVARAFVEAGIHVVLDKPMVLSSDEAGALVAAVEKSNVVFAVTYNYSGYPMVKQAASLVRSGAIGDVRKVFVEYHQGWLSAKLEDSGQKQAEWRTDPARSGIAGCVGDIGTHAENLAHTITGLEIESLCADVSTFVEGRALDDDAAVLLRFKGGAKGTLTCSQVCFGEENNLSIRVYGSHGAIAWRQEEPNTLILTPVGGPKQIIRPGGPETSASAHATRLPPGHPEAFIEAFANIYRGAIEAIRARRASQTPTGLATEFPSVHDGARGVRFIERVIESGRAGGAWVKFD
ncbi:MAG: Gfo/Idh/MocA family oxidoreductase [Phycisphaeraceae bacterium]|nr:Gfo/Idh/MocA family oxidoreductase [Phycisphaeraceae bacterium]MCW5764255.1 Gfo/Idh/MocA family oxidoreductase [Phycisphaeraceae bacterium]